MGAHEELGRNAELAEEKAEEFVTLDRVKLSVIPDFALGGAEGLP